MCLWLCGLYYTQLNSTFSRFWCGDRRDSTPCLHHWTKRSSVFVWAAVARSVAASQLIVSSLDTTRPGPSPCASASATPHHRFPVYGWWLVHSRLKLDTVYRDSEKIRIKTGIAACKEELMMFNSGWRLFKHSTAWGGGSGAGNTCPSRDDAIAEFV